MATPLFDENRMHHAAPDQLAQGGLANGAKVL
jgi:hypothetical protein